MPLNNKQHKSMNFLFNLNPVKHKYSSSIITLDKCNGSCSTLTEISDRICVPNKIQNLSIFQKKKRKKKSKKLTKQVLCECKSKCDGIKCNSNQILNNRKCWCECKNHRKKARKLHF